MLSQFGLNRVIKYLVLSDLIFFTAWGLISPIFAIFILERISGGNAFVVGMSAGVVLIVRAIFRIPFGVYADKNIKTAYWLMVLGLFVSALLPLGLIFSSLPIHIYLIQALDGIVLAMSTAGWTCIYSRNLDHGKESTEWGVDAVAVEIGPGLAGIIGGAAVAKFGFNLIFLVVLIVGLAGVFLLLAVKKEILSAKQSYEKKGFRTIRKYKSHSSKVVS